MVLTPSFIICPSGQTQSANGIEAGYVACVDAAPRPSEGLVGQKRSQGGGRAVEQPAVCEGAERGDGFIYTLLVLDPGAPHLGEALR